MTIPQRTFDIGNARLQGCSACRGFSLIEVLVTVLVLSIGLLGLAGLQGVSVRNNHSAYLRTQATYLAYEIDDAMRANRDVALAGGYALAWSTAPSVSDSIAQADLSAWRNRLIGLLPAADTRIQINKDCLQNDVAGILAVTVRWDDSRGVETPQDFCVATKL
ncbi:type IV pilus modification protein PilV [Sedimenticola hydrogenitrophicus]|uniref:type IV pilus modification protein PilV n=1 Tax=Sedimenticola hydrogenitrophicus TaxID=2967975 RepID=UPI0023B08D3D|nr:type IV pilus modification protein PilV [Sedimenticola hydrogenitrophicus]